MGLGVLAAWRFFPAQAASLVQSSFLGKVIVASKISCAAQKSCRNKGEAPTVPSCGEGGCGNTSLESDVMNFDLDLRKRRGVGTHTKVVLDDRLNFDLVSGILQLCCSLELQLELTLARNMKCSPGVLLVT